MPFVCCTNLQIASWIKKNNVVGYHGVCLFVYSQENNKTRETESMKGTKVQGKNGKKGRSEQNCGDLERERERVNNHKNI